MTITTILIVAAMLLLSQYIQWRRQHKLLRDVALKFELLGHQMKQFTKDVVECLSNNFDGFSASLGEKPCNLHEKSIEELKRKYSDHEYRIVVLENKVRKLEGGS